MEMINISDEDLRTIVVDNLERYMTKHKFSKKTVAAKLGIDHTYLISVMSGKRKLSKKLYDKILDMIEL